MSKSGSKKKRSRKRKKTTGSPRQPSAPRRHKLATMGIWAIAIVVAIIVLALFKTKAG